MKNKYFIHRILALLLTLFMSYTPIFWKVLSTENLNIINIMKHEEIIFSLLALLASCLFDLFENDLHCITISLSLLVVEIIVITVSIFLYIYQSNGTNNNSHCWVYNTTLLVISIGLYIMTYRYISKKQRYNEADINPNELKRLVNMNSSKRI